MNTETKETNQSSDTSLGFRDKLGYHLGCDTDEISIEKSVVDSLSELAALRDKIKAMAEVITELRSDLFLQLEPRFGPKFASEYPSIVKSRAGVLGVEKSIKNG